MTEHLFVISPDLKHDHHSVHHCQTLVAQYLKLIDYKVKVMHEWTDGCTAQYKSQHCMGHVNYSETDFGFPAIRNYFETSNVKGPQDGAGANLKSKANMAVIRRQHTIQNASDLYNFANGNLQLPLAGVRLNCRVFFYVENSDCACCNACYIGETGRHFSTRVREHLSSDKSSHIFKHLLSSERCCQSCSTDCFEILDSAHTKFQLKLKEAMHIN